MIDSLRSRIRAVPLITSMCVITLVLLTGTAMGQATITPNYKDADIQQIIEAVG